jgi:hypothetical protein
MLRTFVNCAMNIFWPWRYDVNKTPPFRHIPIAKDGTKTIAHLPDVPSLITPQSASKNWARLCLFECTQIDTLFTMTDLLVSHCKQTETLTIRVKWNK